MESSVKWVPLGTTVNKCIKYDRVQESMEQGIVNVRCSESTCRELDEMLESIKSSGSTTTTTTSAVAVTAAANHPNMSGGNSGGASSESSSSYGVVGRQVDEIRNRFISPVIK